MRAATGLVLAVVLASCSTAPAPEEASPSPSPAEVVAGNGSPSPTASAEGDAASVVPPLAAAPDGDSSLWLDTIGAPVVAAIRTSTPLARLAELDPGDRERTCRQVATDLDGIAPPQVLTGLAITADAETATLLVGDLQAKGDLLAACVAGGPDLEALVAEVERTHAVAVAWLSVLGGGG